MAEFPGGKVERGEDSAAAAIRECWEEADVRIEVLGEYLAKTHRYEHGLLEQNFFRCHIVDGSERTPRAPFRWVEASELAKLEFPAANAPVTELLLRTTNPASNAS
jgi:8-oxo-dGTP diphosphatase